MDRQDNLPTEKGSERKALFPSIKTYDQQLIMVASLCFMLHSRTHPSSAHLGTGRPNGAKWPSDDRMSYFMG